VEILQTKLMYDSVSRYVQLGSIKLYQPEDYLMVIVFVSSSMDLGNLI
jgi:hypothetical protein